MSGKKNIKNRLSKLIDWCTANKNYVLVLLCLLDHAFLFLWFLLVPHIVINSILNLVSVFIYSEILLLKKYDSPAAVSVIYWEILAYAFITEIILGSALGFHLYIIVLLEVAVVFYLTSFDYKTHLLFELFGIFILVILYPIQKFTAVFFSLQRKMIEPYTDFLYNFNMIVVVFAIVIVAFIFGQEIRKTNRELDYRATHDQLTDMYNRTHMYTCIAERSDSDNLIMLMSDIDDFKKKNDTYGHLAGDYILKQVARMIMERTDKKCVPIRWGGEEFMFILFNTPKQSAVKLAETLRTNIASNETRFNGMEINITVTFGVSDLFPVSDYENAIRQCDDRLYKGKRSGKNCVISD